MFNVFYFTFDLLFELEHPDFLERGGFEEGGRMLL
jgi:hypothetical protein